MMVVLSQQVLVVCLWMLPARLLSLLLAGCSSCPEAPHYVWGCLATG